MTISVRMASRPLPLLRLALGALCLMSLACGPFEGSQESRVASSVIDAGASQDEGLQPEDHVADGGVRDRAVPPDTTPSAESAAVEKLTGARTRVVWTQDLGDGKDYNSKGDQLTIMGYDSHDGRGEHAILATPANYAKPLITPAGDRVVFTDRKRNAVFVVNWDGSGLRGLTDGFALAVWIDPDTKIEWVYVGSDPKPKPLAYRVVTRYQIDRPKVGEVVWKKRPVDANSFQLSADGRLAGGLFPWPRAGVAQLPNGSWKRLGHGCWTALASDNSHLFWYFDGSHRHLTIVDVDRDVRWQVSINRAPGIDGYEVYHPKWTNDPRFLTVTGPYTVGRKANKIRGGGQQVEIYLGRFAADFTAVENWVRVTRNGLADFYPDAWIDPSDRPRAVVTGKVGPDTSRPQPGQPNRERAERLVVEARVVEDTPIPTPKSIAPYREALLVNEYEVVSVLEGVYDEQRILVAHWVIRDGQVLSTAERGKGSLHRLAVEAYAEHQELEGQRLVMDSDAFDLRLYYDVDS